MLYLSGVGLAYITSDINFLWIVIAVGALQVISPVTKFCPVYTILNKLMPDSDQFKTVNKMKSLLRILIVLVAITVLSAWTYRLDLETVYRGGDAKNMIEEFQAYGLSQTTMVVVGVFKVVLALMLLLGLKFKKLIIPAAAGMAMFMTAAVYFHFSISDPIIPTAPSLAMLCHVFQSYILKKNIADPDRYLRLLNRFLK